MKAGCAFGNPRVTLRPIRTVDRLEPHPAVANMDLKSIAIVLQLVRPARAAGRLSHDDRGRWDE
jgi:hypothetical protein